MYLYIKINKYNFEFRFFYTTNQKLNEDRTTIDTALGINEIFSDKQPTQSLQIVHFTSVSGLEYNNVFPFPTYTDLQVMDNSYYYTH